MLVNYGRGISVRVLLCAVPIVATGRFATPDVVNTGNPVTNRSAVNSR